MPKPGQLGWHHSARPATPTGLRRRTRAFATRAAIPACLTALLTACPPAPPQGTVNVAVTLGYADQEDGLTHPVVQVPVEVWSFAPRGAGVWTWAKVGSATTDQTGSTLITSNFQNDRVRYAVRVFLKNSGARCCSGWVLPGMPLPFGGDYIHLGADTGGSPTELTIDQPGELHFNHTFTGDVASAFNILDVLRNMADFVRRHEADVKDDRIEVVTIGIDKKTWFDPVAYTVDFVPRTRWMDSAIRHEYGHYVQAQIGSLAWIASTHSGCTPSEMHTFGGFGNAAGTEDGRRRQHAWLEGFADWLEQAAYADNPSLYAPDSSAGYLETATCREVGPWPDGDRFENHVAAFLWDMIDPYSLAEADDKDDGAQQIGRIIRAVDTDLDHYHWPEVSELSTAMSPTT